MFSSFFHSTSSDSLALGLDNISFLLTGRATRPFTAFSSCHPVILRSFSRCLRCCRLRVGIAGMTSSSASPSGGLAAAGVEGFFLVLVLALDSASSVAIFFCSLSMAFLLCPTDICCHTNGGMCIGLLEPLYLLALKPSAL